MNGWTVAWVLWLVMFAVIEGAAILRKGKDDTLSEHVWKWFQIRESRQWNVRRWALAVFLVWLLVHFVAGF